jgi:ankyrin repeat protein
MNIGCQAEGTLFRPWYQATLVYNWVFNMMSVPGAASHQSASNQSGPSGHPPPTGVNAPPIIRNLMPVQNSMLDEWEFLEKSVRLRRTQEQHREKSNTEIIGDSGKDGNDAAHVFLSGDESPASSDTPHHSDGGSQTAQQAFFKAIRENNSSRLSEMIASPEWTADLNAVDPETGLTPLSLAVRSGHIGCVKFLLKQGVDVNARNNDGLQLPGKSQADGSTPLLIAVNCGNEGMVGLLLLHGADMWMTGPGKLSAMDLAVRNPKAVAAFETLLSFYVKGWHEERTVYYRMHLFGAAYRRFHYKQAEEAAQLINGTAMIPAEKTREQRWKEVYEVTDFSWYTDKFSKGLATLTLVAAEGGSRRAVEILLAFGAQLGDRPETWRNENCKGCHALSIAATLGHVAVVKLLVESGAIGIDTVDANGDTALHCAARENRLDAVAYLLGKNARRTVRNKLNKTAFESCDKNVAVMALFFPEKQRYDSVDRDTPLIYTARRNAQGAFAYLLGKGQDVNKENKKGETALSVVVESAELAVIKLLVESHILDVNRTFRNGYTALMHAVRAGNLDTVAYLLDVGAKIMVENYDGHDAMKISRECGDQAMEMLLASARTIDVANGDGDTALIFAVRRNSPYTVDFLRRHGADPGIMNKKGETARSISLGVQAPDADSNEVLTLLCSYSWLTELTTGRTPEKAGSDA